MLAASVLAVCLMATIWRLHRPLPPPRISRYVQITHDGRRKWLAGVDASRLYANGKVIRFSKGNQLWEISSHGSHLHPLLLGWHTSGTTCCGRWTPDGKFFLFASHESPWAIDQIWALDERSGLLRQPPAGPVPLTTGPIAWTAPYPSTDGTKIFSSGYTLRGELSRVDPATKEIKPFLGGISADNVSFSRDGRFITYASFPEGVLWKVNRDGSSPVQLTDPPMHVGGPRWSPDGSQILFCALSADLISTSGPERKALEKGHVQPMYAEVANMGHPSRR